MKKYILLFLTAAGVGFADTEFVKEEPKEAPPIIIEHKIVKEDVNRESFVYLNGISLNTNLAKDLLVPHYIGLGCRYMFNKHGIDLNINVPYKILKSKDYHYAHSDIAYVRALTHNYYYQFGISNSFGKDAFFKFHNISPFIAFGKTFNIFNIKMFAHAKINSLIYFTKLETIDKDGYSPFKKNHFWKYSAFNLCAGVGF